MIEAIVGVVELVVVVLIGLTIGIALFYLIGGAFIFLVILVGEVIKSSTRWFVSHLI